MDWRYIFYFSFVMNLLITLVMFRKLGESIFIRDSIPFSFSGLLEKYLSILKSPVYLGYALTAGLITSAYLSFASIMPYIFVLMGLVTFGRGFVIPNAQSGAISSLQTSKGTANGLMVFMQLTTASIKKVRPC